MDFNRLKAKSGETFGGAANALAQSNMPLLLNIGNATGHEDRASMGVKLTLSAIGMARSLAQNGAKSGDENTDEAQGKGMSSLSTQAFPRYDSDRDFYFTCGDYYMPLSIRFTLKASKNFAESQLIDGAHIIERTSKAPKTIDATIRLERKQDEWPTMLHIVNKENQYNPVPDISAMIHDLYERQDVFTVENPILNGEHGVTHVVMRDYTIIPGEGTTLMTMQMSLMQIDIKANIINNEQNNAGAGEVLNGTEPLA